MPPGTLLTANGMTRQILHVDMDAFFVSIEEVQNPALKGKPVVVGGNPEGRGVVAAASYEARKYDVHSAMPVRTARRLCPQAIFLPSRHSLYGEVSEAIHKMFTDFSPVVEMTSIDEAYLDLTGCDRLYGSAFRAADQLIRAVRKQFDLPCSVGVSTSKLVSKIASDQAKPHGLLCILPGHERAFLRPLPIRRLPGVGKVTEPEIKAMGIRTIGDLQKIPGKALTDKFGKFGEWLSLKAQGQDTGAYEYSETPQSISHETTFSEDSADPEMFERTLSYLCQRVARRLRDHGLFTRTVGLKLRNPNFRTFSRSHTLARPTNLDSILFETVLALLGRTYRPKTRVRLLGVQASQLTSSPEQLGLLEQDREGKWDRIYQAADKIRDRYGFQTLQLARSLDPAPESTRSPHRKKRSPAGRGEK